MRKKRSDDAKKKLKDGKTELAIKRKNLNDGKKKRWQRKSGELCDAQQQITDGRKPASECGKISWRKKKKNMSRVFQQARRPRPICRKKNKMSQEEWGKKKEEKETWQNGFGKDAPTEKNQEWNARACKADEWEGDCCSLSSRRMSFLVGLWDVTPTPPPPHPPPPPPPPPHPPVMREKSCPVRGKQ